MHGGCTDNDKVRFLSSVIRLYDTLVGSSRVVVDCCAGSDEPRLDCSFHVGVETKTIRSMVIPGTGLPYSCIS